LAWGLALLIMALAGCPAPEPATQPVRLPRPTPSARRTTPVKPPPGTPKPEPAKPEFFYLYLASEPVVPPNPSSVVVECPADRLEATVRAVAWLHAPAALAGDSRYSFMVYLNGTVWQAAERTARQVADSPATIAEMLLAELRPSGLVAPPALEGLLAALADAQADSQLSGPWRWSAAMWRGRLLLVQSQDPQLAAESFAAARRIAPRVSPEDLAASVAQIEALLAAGKTADARSAWQETQSRCGQLTDSAAGQRAERLLRRGG
jgi:hypothetical protein